MAGRAALSLAGYASEVAYWERQAAAAADALAVADADVAAALALRDEASLRQARARLRWAECQSVIASYKAL